MKTQTTDDRRQRSEVRGPRAGTAGLWRTAWVFAAVLCLCFSFNSHAATVEPPPDPGFEVSVIASDVIAEIEVVAGGPFRAVALVKKTLKGDAPKVIELEGYNSFNWDTISKGLPAGWRGILFLSRTERPDVFTLLTPAGMRLNLDASGLMFAVGDPPARFRVKPATLEEGLSLLIEKNSTGAIPSGAESYVRGLWGQDEIELRYLAVEMAGALKDERALSILLEASKDKLLKLRLRSIEALGKVGTAQALSALRGLLKDEKKSVSREAAHVLAILRDADSVLPLLEWTRKNVGAGAASDADQVKAEGVALEAIALARAAAIFGNGSKIARALSDVARIPNEKVATAALDACASLSPAESVPPLLELAQDRLYDQRDRAFWALRRMALKPVKDVDEFQDWWRETNKKLTEDFRRDMAETAARALGKSEEYDERRKALETLRSLPGGVGIVSSAPLLLNTKMSGYFGEDDLAAWNSPLAAPFLIERLGRDSASTRRSALDALVALCVKNERLATVCWPLIRAHLADRESAIRRTAEMSAAAFGQGDGIDALFDAIAARGVMEPQDCCKDLYKMTARTMGFSLHEPVPDQIVARRHFRGWWAGARKNFRGLAISTPVNVFAFYPGEAGRIHVDAGLDPAARAAKFEAQALLEDSDPSEAAVGLLMNERSAGDEFWKKLAGQNRQRDRARGLLGALGSPAMAADLIKHLDTKAEAEPALTRALALLSLSATGPSNAKAVVAWLKANDAASLPMKRLGVIGLGFANKDAESLAYLNEIADAALKIDPTEGDAALKPDELNNAYALLHSVLAALCAREDSNAILIKLLNESPESRIRETAARALSLRRDRAAIPGIVKTLEKSDRFSWLDVTFLLEPLLNADDGAVFSSLLDSESKTTRLAAVWILARQAQLGNDPQTRGKVITALADESNQVRYYAADALGKRKAKAALAGLVKLLDDTDEDVRAVAAQAIGETGDKEACVEVGKAALMQFRVLDARWMKALAESGVAKFFAEILRFANSNLYPEQRAGLEALASADNPAATDRLLKTFRNNDEILQTFAVDLLAERGDAALALVKDDIVSKDKAVRAHVVHLLSRMNTPGARAALLEMQRTEGDEGVKMVIEWVLARK